MEPATPCHSATPAALLAEAEPCSARAAGARCRCAWLTDWRGASPAARWLMPSRPTLPSFCQPCALCAPATASRWCPRAAIRECRRATPMPAATSCCSLVPARCHRWPTRPRGRSPAARAWCCSACTTRPRRRARAFHRPLGGKGSATGRGHCHQMPAARRCWVPRHDARDGASRSRAGGRQHLSALAP